MSKAGVLIWRKIFETGDKNRIAKQHPDLTGLSFTRDIPYLSDGDRGHLFDIYRMKDAAKDSPVMINIHGGGLFASYKEVNAHFNYEIAKMGYTVVSISYRRIPETTMWHQIDDVMNALRYIDQHSEELGLNREKMYISGDSAGALLTLFALSINSSETLQKYFGIEGTGLRFMAASFISIMLETQRKDLMSAINSMVTSAEDDGKAYERFILDPSRLLDKAELPPIQMFTSEEDLIQKDSLKLDKLLRQMGFAHEMHNYARGKENKLVHVFAVCQPYYPESKEVFSLMDEFFGRNA